jgi:hypothetical protein
MAKKTTILNFVLDETGSMQVCWDATISGFNEYVGNLRKDKNGTVMMTLTQFNSTKIETVLDHIPIKKVPDLNRDTYRPNNLTPLYDAIAQTIKATEKRGKKYKKKPAVLCVIMTDGHENASREYTRESIFNLVKEKEKDGWTFAYLGANQDAWAVGQSIGIPKGSSISYSGDARGTKAAFRGAAAASVAYVAAGSLPTSDFFDGKQHIDDDDEE